MQFVYDPERLIEEVKKRPGIWDYTNQNYRTLATRSMLWHDVVNELLDPAIKVTPGETREIVVQLQKKWKGMKDCFNKSLQKPSKSKRPYIYSRHLQFLVQNNGGNAGDGASSDSDDGRKWKATKKKRVNIKKRKKDSTSEEDDNDQYEDFCINDDDNASNDVTTAQNEFAFASSDHQSSENEDSDRMFLLSLLPHMKEVPVSERLHIKMELLQVLQNAKLKKEK